MIIHGHRGARFEAPENTLPGFHYAVELGLRAIEFDIHMTSDEHLVVIHDANVDRTTNGTGAVANMTFDEIRALDAQSIFPEWPEPCIVPTFAEVMDVVGHLESVEIEIKTDLPERLDLIVPKILAELEKRGFPEGATLTSFDVYALELVQRLMPEHPRGYIGKWDAPGFLETAKRLGATRAGIPNTTGSAEIVRAAQDQGMTVTGWPCNTREEYDTLMSWHVDYLCSDAPTTILGFLNEP